MKGVGYDTCLHISDSTINLQGVLWWALELICDRNAVSFEDELELEILDMGRLREMAQTFPRRVREMVKRVGSRPYISASSIKLTESQA